MFILLFNLIINLEIKNDKKYLYNMKKITKW